MVLLDTDFVIDSMRRDPDAVALMQELVAGHEPVAVSAITVMQLHHGIARSALRARETSLVEHALKGFTTYALTHAIAQRAGLLDGELANRGARIGTEDVVIAATAIHHDEPLVTRNERHFAEIQGVRLIGY